MEQTNAVVDTVNTAATGANTAGSWWGMLLYCLVIFAIIYIFMVRPNKKRMAEYQKMLDSLQVGNRIMAKINEKTIEMEVALGVVIEVNKNAVASVE